MAEVVFEHVSKMFQDEIILDDISFQIEKGEFVFVIGKSGAGKSTLLRLIMKQEEVTSGKIYVFGKMLQGMKRREVLCHRRKIGVMSSEVGLLDDRNVYENIKLAVLAIGREVPHMRQEIIRVLGQVGVASKIEAYPRELSGGEYARVLLARVLALRPGIIIADEPTANLDPDVSWDLMLLLQEINAKGITVIVSSHDRELVTIMKKRVITLVAGTMAADEKQAIYNQKALDIFEERRILEKREKNLKKNINFLGKRPIN